MRGRKAKIRRRQPDPKYGSMLTSKFISKVMLHGKKGVAQKLFYEALESAAAEVKADPMEFLNRAVDNVRPALEIRARRVGGANYQVPVPVNAQRQETLVIRWIVDTARSKGGADFVTLLKQEFTDAYNGVGDAVKKKEDTERMAEANKAFAHFRW